MSIMEKVFIHGEICGSSLTVDDTDCNPATLSSENMQGDVIVSLTTMLKSDDKEIRTKGKNLLLILASTCMSLTFGTDYGY